MQEVHIHLGGEPGSIDQSRVLHWHRGDVNVSYLPNATSGGRSAVALMVETPAGKLIGIELTARNLMCIAGAVRGKLIESGEIEIKRNPGIAMSAGHGGGVVHFSAEAPLQSWDYDVVHAKKFWRLLRELAETAAR